MPRKSILLSSMISVLMLSGNAIAAETGTIDFVGEITDTTCNVFVGNDDSGAATITLPSVQMRNLGVNGSESGTEAFSLRLDCNGSEANVAISFDETVNTTEAGGRLANTAPDGADGVSLVLRDGDNNPVDVKTYKSNTFEFAGGESAEQSYNYTVQYYVEDTDALTPGAVSAQVTYNLTYQ